jgi:hypothetical protein
MSALLAHHQLMMAGGAGSAWSPTVKYAGAALSGGNLVASITAGLGSVLGTHGHDASDDRYFEITVGVTGGTLFQHVGVGKAAANVNSYLGSDANGWSYSSANGNRYSNGSNAGYGATFAAGDVIGVRVHAGNITFYKNGASQGLAWSGITGTVYPAWSTGTSGAGTRTATLNVGASPFVALPAGSAAWG